MDQDHIADRLAIAELVNLSMAGVMRKDREAWGATWAENGTWKIDMLDEPLCGREAIVGLFGTIIDRFEFVAMTGYVTQIAVDGDRATGMAYSQELLFPKGGGQKILCGCFHDDYVRIAGNWHFQSRTYETLHRGTIIEAGGAA